MVKKIRVTSKLWSAIKPRSRAHANQRTDGDIIESSEARLFLQAVDRYLYEFDDGLPASPKSTKAREDCITGLLHRLVSTLNSLTVTEHVLENNTRLKWSTIDRMRQGLLEAGRLHDRGKKREAIELFNTLVAEGRLIKSAEAAVFKKFGVPPRTLRTWRKS